MPCCNPIYIKRWSLQHFAHVITAMLSWHMQILVVDNYNWDTTGCSFLWIWYVNETSVQWISYKYGTAIALVTNICMMAWLYIVCSNSLLSVYIKLLWEMLYMLIFTICCIFVISCSVCHRFMPRNRCYLQTQEKDMIHVLHIAIPVIITYGTNPL